MHVKKLKLPNDLIIGIDPGITGALVALDLLGNVAQVWSFVSESDFKQKPGYTHLTYHHLLRIKTLFACLELENGYKPIFFIERPLKAVARIGAQNWGYIQYLVGFLQAIASDIGPVIILGQHLWKRRLFKVAYQPEVKDKQKAYDLALEMFGSQLPITKINTGLSDAALIAEYGRQIYLEKNGNLDLIESACAL
jgi:hypothetical protein